MSIAATIALASAALAAYVAALARRFSYAPGWRDQRWFALAAVSVAVFAALDVTASIDVPVAAVVWCSRGQLVMAGVHIYAWIRYSDDQLGSRPGYLRAVLDHIPMIAGLSALVPGLAFQDAVRQHTYAPLGLTYRDVVPTPLGEATLGLFLSYLLALIGRYALAWRRGVPHAALHLLSLAFLVAMAANDALVTAGILDTPYLIDLGFIGPIAAIAWSVTARFTGDARDLAELRGRLERLVDERTRALALAQEQLLQSREQLLRSEKLAAVGQLAAGVAHEVNNPAAAVAANLRYLLKSHGESGASPEDAPACLAESLGSMERIARIVRQLLDAGRLAAAPVVTEPVLLAPLARESVGIARARCSDHVRIVVQVDEDLAALANEGALVQVLVNLIVNGAQAIPAGRTGGTVAVRGERAEGRVRVVVEDNGEGMTPEVLRRAFEPFFTTKPFGAGTGLGLAVSRGLLHSLGGDLRLEAAAAGGTRAVVDLAEAAPGELRPAASVPHGPGGPLRRLLIVDDDQDVLRSFARVLQGRYQVAVAGGVEEGLSRLAVEPFDAVLCDVMMPDGGGERFHRQLRERSPHQARRLVFVTGGATNEAVRRFLAHQSQPVLEKPLDLAALHLAVERLDRSSGGAAEA